MTLRLALLLTLCVSALSGFAEEPATEMHSATKLARRQAIEQLVQKTSAQIDSGQLQGRELAEAYRHRGIAYNYLLAYDKALADFDRAIGLHQVDAGYYEDRAIAHLKLRDFGAANRDLDMALGLDTKRASAYREKGRVAAYQGDFERASTEFLSAVRNSSGQAVVYGAMWLHIALSRAGRPQTEPLSSIKAQMNPGQWPYPIIQVFLREISPDAALGAAASPIPEDDLMRKCEAYFYIGEQYLIEGDAEQASAAFQAAVATQVSDFLEFDWAARELERLEQR